MSIHRGNIPDPIVIITCFAENLARQYAGAQVHGDELFAALAGLVAMRDAKIASDCLKALDDALASGAYERGSQSGRR